MTRIGTSHFLSFAAAMRYYRDYYDIDACIVVPQKIREGEITIGRPKVKVGEKLVLIDCGTRYAIEVRDE